MVSAGLEGTIISNTGDYGLFWGHAQADSFSISHFDGSYVYMLTGPAQGDTLRGVFHAGLRTQTRFIAVRSTGAPASQVAQRDHDGGHGTVPLQLPRSRRPADHRGRLRDSRARWS